MKAPKNRADIGRPLLVKKVPCVSHGSVATIGGGAYWAGWALACPLFCPIGLALPLVCLQVHFSSISYCTTLVGSECKYRYRIILKTPTKHHIFTKIVLSAFGGEVPQTAIRVFAPEPHGARSPVPHSCCPTSNDLPPSVIATHSR